MKSTGSKALTAGIWILLFLTLPLAIYHFRAAWVPAVGEAWERAGRHSPANPYRDFLVKTEEGIVVDGISPDGWISVTFTPPIEGKIEAGELRAFFFDDFNDRIGKARIRLAPMEEGKARSFRLGPIPPTARRAKLDTLTNLDISPFPTPTEIEHLREKGKPLD